MSSETHNASPNSSGGSLKAEEAFGGPIDATEVNYRQSPVGTRGITVDGKVQAPNPDPGDGRPYYRGIQIDLPYNSELGEFPVQPWPVDRNVKYFTQIGDHRTSTPADEGTIKLTLIDVDNAHVQGSFAVMIPIQGKPHAFKGTFDIWATA
ncbi:hypothetical protein [Pseudomonas moraviensis]|uniref:Uncharacterized protein n=1 Tax=Pseudomonas moraviensis TaxID=321662 RepID=A0A7Y9VXS4_9PSED|nr:hypothetical protein [Pseudomonas moraviensis]NYH10033.1 hypothetical protein [Pseudomonas moraviensis]